eukprot:CAMPEP_0195518926 /NCGR_PEP_ID=MMETSP0794_2-20130614/13961_1 /TAXON_ID=515487 /ORGANISM="Stephanopyxis turris, Strain CCMP 815" /LENGTH=176 /DNA_ID=CAMNT_0040647975 /DNA_START=8 /DNA_END=534 /DNA_ORIENTATION=+
MTTSKKQRVLFLVICLTFNVAQAFLTYTIRQPKQQSIKPWRNRVVLNESPLKDLGVLDTTEGTGDIAKNGDIVTVKYVGSLLSTNTQFDKSMISFKLGAGRVLPGCEQGIVGMRVGGTRVIQIPSLLGYGPAGFGGPAAPYTIPPDADLEFVVELTALASGKMAEMAAGMGIGLDP